MNDQPSACSAARSRRRVLRCCAAVAVLLSGVGFSAGAVGVRGRTRPAARPAVITVDAGSVLGPVNRRVLGNNVLAYLHDRDAFSKYGSGMWDPDRRRPVAAMVRFARQAGATTLRWPGGCKVHYYNWKLTVGPLSDRPKQPFGLPEFLTLCKAVGADPIITLAAFWGSHTDAADLVEYLNAPVGSNPNGGTDWAKLRAADGHAEPIGAVWFEYGNETNHGGHRTFGGPILDRLTDEQYARNYLAYRKAMRAVDPNVKLGAVLVNDNQPTVAKWSETVLRMTGKVADFYIHHAYLPVYNRNDSRPPAAELYRLAFAAPRQMDLVYAKLNERIRELTGRRVPLAITEYNGHFVQQRPVPYRLALGTAVEVADLIRVLMDPRHNIDNAQYWQFANEYWGMVKGYRPPYTLRPAYHVFKLYNDHLGDRLVAGSVQCGRYDTDGGYRVLPQRGRPGAFRWLTPERAVKPAWRLAKITEAEMTVTGDGTLDVRIVSDRDFNFYHAAIELPAEPRTAYRVWAEVRTEGLTKKGAQIQVGDARGWLATRSASLSPEVRGRKWTRVSADYATLADTKAVLIHARRLEGGGEKGRMQFRDLRIRRFQPASIGAVPYLGVLATKGERGVSVFIVNRRIDAAVAVRIEGVKAAAANAAALTGPNVDATNEKDPRNVGVKPLPTRIAGGAVELSLPPHSFTAVTIHGRTEKTAPP